MPTDQMCNDLSPNFSSNQGKTHTVPGFCDRHKVNRFIEKRSLLFLIFKDIIYLFLDREEGTKRDWERKPSIGCLSHVPDEGPGPNPGMCPDQELNQQPFSLRDSAQPTEPHQSRQEETC